MSRFLPLLLLSVAAFAIFGVAQDVPAAQSTTENSAAAPSHSPSISVVDDATSDHDPIANTADVDPASLLPGLPSLPSKEKATLVGGTIEHLDRVRDELTIRIFGGNRMKVYFDPRTKISQDSGPASVSDLRKGDRVYLDTILDGDMVFARNIRLRRAAATGESQGVVVSYRQDKNELMLRDSIAPRTFEVRTNSWTRIMKGDRQVSTSYLTPGTLIAIKFGSQQDGRDVAHEISILAMPGSTFTFVGKVAGIDLRTGLLAINSSIDRKTYEVYLNSDANVNYDLRPGAQVTVVARYDGSRYVVQSVSVNSASNATPRQ